MEWVLIVPSEGEAKNVAKALLALADSPRDVRTEENGTVFSVPGYLADRYTTPAELMKPKPRRSRAKKEEGDE